MLVLLALLFVVAPIAELYVIVQVAHGIGVPETILLLVAVSVVGAWLAKRQGLGVLRRMQATVAAGQGAVRASSSTARSCSSPAP